MKVCVTECVRQIGKKDKEKRDIKKREVSRVILRERKREREKEKREREKDRERGTYRGKDGRDREES